MTTLFLPNKFWALSNKRSKATSKIDPLVFGQRLGLMAKLFGCWHNNISRPFTKGKTSYRLCLQCGARKQFNARTLETQGSFYFPPVIESHELN